MLGKLFGTPRGTLVLNCIAMLIGIFLVIRVDSPRTGTIWFLIVISIESGVFSLIYGLRSDWRKEPAARAVFWYVLSVFALCAQAITLYASPNRYWWTDDVRELMYMAMAVAGLNLVLTLIRVLGRRVYSNKEVV